MADIRAGNNQVHGSIPHDSVDADNPVKIGGKAASSVPASVAAGDRVDAYFDTEGRQSVFNKSESEQLTVSAVTVTANLQTRDLAIDGWGTIAAVISGTWVGTLTFYTVMYDGTVVTTRCYSTQFGNVTTTTSANAQITFYPLNGARYVRIASTAWTSGTATITWHRTAKTSAQSEMLIGTIAAPAVVTVIGGRAVGGGPITELTVNDLGSVCVAGDRDHDETDAYQPIKIGGRAQSAIPTAVAANDRTNAYFDLNGRLAVFDGGLSLTTDSLTEGSTGATAPTTGSLIGAKVNTSAPTYSDGHMQPLSMDTSGALRVTGGGTQYTDDAALANGAGSGTLMLGHSGSNVRAILTETTGAVVVSDGGISFGVTTDSEGTTGATTGTIAGLAGGAVTTAAPTYTTATMNALSLDTSGNLRVAPSGNIAHDGVDSGNPLKIGGKVSTATPTAVANADRTDAWFDEFGRIVVSDRDLELGINIGSTGLRDRLMAQRYTVLADSLADGLAGFWTSATANGGTTTSTGGEGVIQTSAAATGSAQITSTVVSYFPGQVAWLNSAVRFNDTGSAGNIRRIGVFTVSGTTPQNGFYYELNGTTLNAVVVNAGIATTTASASWSRFAVAPFTLDTNFHSFEIRYTANTVWFYVDNVLRHQVSGTTSAITATLNFPITISSINTSGATNRLIAVRNVGVGRFGEPSQTVDETGLSAVRAIGVGGGTPHDSVDSGNPLKIGGKASTANPTAVAAADRVDAWFDTLGRFVNLPYTNTPLTAYVNLTTTSASTLVAAVASNSIYVTSLHGSNAGASLTTVSFKEGAAGTVKYAFAMAPNGGGFTLNLNVPWKVTVATLLEVIQSAAVSAHITVNYFVAP